MFITSLLVLILSSYSACAADAFGITTSLAKPTTTKGMRKLACDNRRYSSSSLMVALRGGQQSEVDGTSPSPSTFCKMTSVAVAAPLSSFASFYAHQLRTRPIYTKSITASVIFGMSDYFAQTIERNKSGGEKETIVKSRILTGMLVGLLVFGPAANWWYSTMFKLWPSTDLLPTLIKAFMGQLLFGPAFTTIFFAAGMIQSGTFSFLAWINKIKNDLPKVAASGAGFWMPVSFVSYKFIPQEWIPLFTNICSFVWTIYLSLVSNRKTKQS